jgi:hypothetical protein
MKKILFSIVITGITMLISCDKPDALKEEAFFIVTNNSTSYNITGVYYANSGYGSNRISSNITPGNSKTFTLNAEDNYIYNIRVTSDNTTDPEYTFDEVHFYDDRSIYVYLTNTGWDADFPW